VSRQSYSMDNDPFLLVSAVLEAICYALTDEQRRVIASDLRDLAVSANEGAENAEQQRFALDVASLAALAELGPDAASDILEAGQPR
jgi:hypothetical protein